ncbi:hypothetical protein [Roseovarius sp.]|jgi:hypothetical protein
MNVNSIVTMILRMVMRTVVSKGMNAGINAMSKRNDADGESAPGPDTRKTQQRARQALKIGRRFGRF